MKVQNLSCDTQSIERVVKMVNRFSTKSSAGTELKGGAKRMNERRNSSVQPFGGSIFLKESIEYVSVKKTQKTTTFILILKNYMKLGLLNV